ncbi:transposase, partial [Escherichia coli]
MKKRNFSAGFKRESAQLVVDQNYTVADAAKAMDIGLSTMTIWVKQLRDERQGKTPKASPITPEQIEIRELRKKLQRIEMENEILKKATVDSICQWSLFRILCKCLFSEVTVQAVTELDNKAAHCHSPVLQRHRPFLGR